MKSIFQKITPKTFYLIFFAFFLYEYGSAIIQVFQLASNFDLNLSTLLAEPKALKHFIRLPLYGLIYFFCFRSIFQNKNKTTYFIAQFFIISHLIFKPLTVFTALFFLNKYKSTVPFSINQTIAVIWGVVIFLIYLFFSLYLKNWWKQNTKKPKS